MSKRLDVLNAVHALVVAALPAAEVVSAFGTSPDDPAVAELADVGPGGRVTIESGDPGRPEVDLSPLTYNWSHLIPLEAIANKVTGQWRETVVDAMLVAIGIAIAADRTLGGTCTWLEAVAPTTDDVFAEGALVPRGASFGIRADYSSPTPI